MTNRPAAPPPSDTVEKLAAEIHDIYQQEAKRQGDVRHKDAYADLPENVKEFDRVLARFIAAREQAARLAGEVEMREAAAKVCEQVMPNHAGPHGLLCHEADASHIRKTPLSPTSTNALARLERRVRAEILRKCANELMPSFDNANLRKRWKEAADESERTGAEQ